METVQNLGQSLALLQACHFAPASCTNARVAHYSRQVQPYKAKQVKVF